MEKAARRLFGRTAVPSSPGPLRLLREVAAEPQPTGTRFGLQRQRHCPTWEESRGVRVSLLRSKAAWSNTELCKGLRSSSNTGGGDTVTPRQAACVGHCFISRKEKPRRCPKSSESKARCCCGKTMTTTSRTRGPKSIGSPPSHNSARERARHAAWQPLRPLPASTLRQVQTAAREKRRSDLRGPVRLPRMLQQQEFQVRLGTARLAGRTSASGRVRIYASVSCSASQCERKVSGNGIGSSSTRSRPTPDIQRSDLDAASGRSHGTPPRHPWAGRRGLAPEPPVAA